MIQLRHTRDSTMPPKGANAKKESGRAKKAENENKKKEAAAAENVSMTIQPVAYVQPVLGAQGSRRLERRC